MMMFDNVKPEMGYMEPASYPSGLDGNGAEMGVGMGMGGGGGGGGQQLSSSSIYLDPSEINQVAEVRRELEMMNPETQKHAYRLLKQEIERLENRMDPEYMEIDIPKPLKIVKKVLIPAHRHPRFNFVGKLLGPGGKTLQALAKSHKCHVWILGRGSTKDRAKEEELMKSGDEKHAHFSLPLHVKIETEAPAQIAYARLAGVLQELFQYMQPVRDEIVQEQMTEMGYEFQPNPGRGRGGMRGAPRGAAGAMRGGPRGRGMVRGRGGATAAPVTYPGYDYGSYAPAIPGAASYEYPDYAGKLTAGRGRARPSPY